jgi:hypothetical protein
LANVAATYFIHDNIRNTRNTEYVTEYGDTHSFPFFPGDKLRNFAIRSRRRTFSTGAIPPLSVTHQAVDLMEA